MKHVSSSINGAIEMSAKRLVTEFEQKLHKVENAISSTKEPVQVCLFSLMKEKERKLTKMNLSMSLGISTGYSES